MKTAIFRIEGMNCEGCASAIKDAVEKETGVLTVSVSLAERQARVVYDSLAVGENRLAAVIEKPGFRVVSLEAA